MTTEFFPKIRTMVDPSFKSKFEDMLIKHPDGKRKLYRKGMQEAIAKSRVDPNMDIM